MKNSVVAIAVCVMVFGIGSAEARSFVGVSTLSGPANTGYAVLSRMCDAKYPASRMCTTSEYLGSIHPAKTVRSHGPAWIQASPISNDMDLSGAGLSVGPNCRAWSSSGFNVWALTVSGPGLIVPTTCTETHQVACCK